VCRNSPVILLLSIVLCLGVARCSYAQNAVPDDSLKTHASVGFPVVFNGDTLFLLRGSLGPFSPAERAAAVSRRLQRLAEDRTRAIDSVTSVHGATLSELLYGDTPIASVTDGDTVGTGLSRDALADSLAARIGTALGLRASETSLRSILVSALFAVLTTVLFVIIVWGVRYVFRRVYAGITSWRLKKARGLMIRNYEVLSSDRIADLLDAFARLLRIGVILLLAYVYLSVVLGYFPWTRGLARTLLDYVVSPLKVVVSSILGYLPKGFFVVVIVVVTRFVLKFVRRIFAEIGRGALTFPGFYAEWAEPTYKIVRFLILGFVVVIIFPYLPGSSSPAFRGVSIFLGILFSLGSSSAIANMVAGLVITYMRPFKVGDRVRIADTEGDVLEKTLLVTRVRTIKNVIVTVPNAMVMSSHIVNYSSSASEDGLILHTGVTIGYDAPWKRVHELLIAAAQATSGILESPAPFVLQTSLDDSYVHYEINAYTDQPNRMANIYSGLHQNIQDKFNEVGVEIMSPSFSAIRDGNRIAIPDQYLPKPYRAPGFRIFKSGASEDRPADQSP
jgi:small-conductance mechanosensitive channel